MVGSLYLQADKAYCLCRVFLVVEEEEVDCIVVLVVGHILVVEEHNLVLPDPSLG